MSCSNTIPPFRDIPCGILPEPQGSTYKITIGKHDKVIIEVGLEEMKGFPKIPIPATLFSVGGFSSNERSNGESYVKIHWNERDRKPESDF